MTPEKRKEKILYLFEQCLHILETKGNDYNKEVNGEIDVHSQFKRSAERCRLPDFDKYDAWDQKYSKHEDAIKTFIGTRVSYGEPIEEKIMDAINFLTLLYTMLEEDKEDE